MVTFLLKRLQTAILFYVFQRKAPGPWCVLPQGRVQGTNFFLSMIQQFSFCFFIQADSSVRFTQFDLKVTDQLPQFSPYFEYKADNHSIFFNYFLHYLE